MRSFSGLLFGLSAVYAQTVTFVPPSKGPLVPSVNYGGPSNSTLPKSDVVHGKVFDRFIQIFLENTDFEEASASPTFQALTKKGILLDNYLAVTHPSEPNYIAYSGGDFFGMADDSFYNIPKNVSTIVDLLEEKKVSWAEYQESMPTDGDGSFSAQLPAYHLNSTTPYTYYVRKHNPLVIYNSVALSPDRAKRLRNFNDFAADLNHSVIPQWNFFTPNMVNDGHDTNTEFISNWLEFFFEPLLKDKRFNDGRTLILLTFDENESRTINNRVWSLLLGHAVPKHLHGTVDHTFYTHYSALSTAQVNWELDCLGRQDTNKTLSNVFSFVADKVKYKNVNPSSVPLLSSSGNTPGPLNPKLYVPWKFFPPNVNAKCANPHGKVFVAPGLNTTQLPPPAPVNLAALNQTVPSLGPPTEK